MSLRSIRILLATSIFFCATAQAAVIEKAKSAIFGSKNPTAKSGPFALVEVNPADLIWKRGRLSSEYVVVDGFAFGIASEYQRQDLKNWGHSTATVGLLATQYFQSQTLRGPFVRGEANVFASQFQDYAAKSGEKYLYGVGLGLDAGYRFSITERITGGAAYGVRRIMPDFFTPNSKTAQSYEDLAGLWDVRVHLSLGLAL